MYKIYRCIIHMLAGDAPDAQNKKNEIPATKKDKSS